MPTQYEVEANNVSVGTTTETKLTLTGLNPGTLYNLKVRARSAAGTWSAWSADCLVITAPLVVPGERESVWIEMPHAVRNAQGQVTGVRYDGLLDEIIPIGPRGFQSLRWTDYEPSYTISVGGYDDNYSVNDYWFLSTPSDGEGRPIGAPTFVWPSIWMELTSMRATLEVVLAANKDQSYQIYQDEGYSAVFTPSILWPVGGELHSSADGEHRLLIPGFELLTDARYRFYLASLGKAVKAVQITLPGVGPARIGISNAAAPTTGPITIGGVTVDVGPNSVRVVLPDGTEISMVGGVVSVSGHPSLPSGPITGKISLGVFGTAEVDTAGNVTITVASGIPVIGGAVITGGPNGGSITFPSGLEIEVDRTGQMRVHLPPGTNPTIVEIVDLASRVLSAGTGAVISIRDALGNIIPLPTAGILGALDAAVTSKGRFQVGVRTASDATYWFDVYTYPKPKIAVDWDRNGVVAFDGSDRTTSATPYRFWVNDDDDDEFVQNTIFYNETEQDDKEVSSDLSKDCNNLVIDRERDLEDLSRLWINAAGLTDALKSGTVRLCLKWSDISGGGPAVRLFKAVENDGGNAYLFNAGTATLQVDQTATTGAHGTAVGSLIDGTNLIQIPLALFSNLTESQPIVHLLFEGVREGKGQLKSVLLNQDDQVIGESAGVWIDLSRPHAFVERFTCGEGSGASVAGSVSIHPGSAPLYAPPGAEEERDYVLYVHGYNMQPFEKQRWLETTYKRLYWLGYKGRVGGLSWPCTFGALGSVRFDVSERRAWEAGARLNEHIRSLNARGYRVHLVAHSQGNVLAAEALRLWKAAGNQTPLVRSYIASQAAVPAACYNPKAPWMPDYDTTVVGGALIPRNPLAPDVYARYWRAGDDDRLPNTWPSSNGSYLSEMFMTSAASRWANFYNISDYALTGNSVGHPGWEIDQRQKPTEWLNESLFNSYSYSHTDGFRKWYGPPGATIVWTAMRFPDERYEIFSYGASTWSLALGTIPTGGVFSNFTNLQSSFHYGSEPRWHSGQFRSFNALRYQFWGAVLDAALIPHLNP